MSDARRSTTWPKPFVEIVPKEGVPDIAGALAPGAPLVIRAPPENTLIDAPHATAGVDAAVAAADVLVEFELTSTRHPECRRVCDAVAALDPATDRVMLTLSTQAPHMMRTGIVTGIAAGRA